MKLLKKLVNAFRRSSPRPSADQPNFVRGAGSERERARKVRDSKAKTELEEGIEIAKTRRGGP